MWSTATTFSELIDVNIKFLKGEINESPWHCGPLNGESFSILDKLIEINEKGLLTTSSQPGVFNFIENVGPYHQKAYVSGFISFADLHITLSTMNVPDYVIVLSSQSGHKVINQQNSALCYPVSYFERNYATAIPLRESMFEEEVGWLKLENPTLAETMLQENYIYVTFISKLANNNDLFDDLIF